MIIDNISEAGSWRRELLARPLNTAQLREFILELEHLLAAEKRKTAEAVALATEATAREMEARAQISALNAEMQAWNARKYD
jgi:hypothetical protein